MEKGEIAVVNNTGPKCPWGQPASSTPCSLTSVMDEEIAKDLQSKENKIAGFPLQRVEETSQMTLEGRASFTLIICRNYCFELHILLF